MSKTTIPGVLCHFAPLVAPDYLYTCYQKEKCCPEGCCIPHPYQMHQVLYYWGIFIFICGAIMATCWLLRSPKRYHERSRNLERVASSESLPRCLRDVCVHYNNEEISMDHLTLAIENRESVDPPNYNSVVPSAPSAPPPYQVVYERAADDVSITRL
ncbi:hypothetical protein FQR65_LT17712 [Abscondita terminalis]|nr:hypothetical protein FQR65_LT17712 [Abscondita terminalis]